MNSLTPSDSEAAELAARLELHPAYRVLRKLVPRQHYQPALPGKPLLQGLVLDTETTGLEPHLGHRLIEIAATPEQLRAVRHGDADAAAVVQSMRLGDGIGLAAVRECRGLVRESDPRRRRRLSRRFSRLRPSISWGRTGA